MQIQKKLVKLDTSATGVNASVVPANFASPSNYTPADTFIKGHLQGIDTKIGTLGSVTGDIGQTSFSMANNTSAANITGLLFANGVTRSAKVMYQIVVDATSDLFEIGSLELVQRGADWVIARTFNGDDSLVDISVTTGGQVQYTTPTYSGFVSATIKFRAMSLEV